MEELREMFCCRCNRPMEPKKTRFEYLGRNFHTDILRCPECGEVFIPEDLVRGRMAEVEKTLESK